MRERLENMEKPLISVIVPIYNIKEYLPRCVHSITAQTYRNLEILLVDDGSTDGTGELCEALAKEDGRIRVFHKANGGSSSARNLGLSQAKGAYLGFVDGDDYIGRDMYARLYEAVESHHVSVAQAGRDELDEEGGRLPDICEPPECAVCVGQADFLRELLLHKGDCSFCTKLFQRELFAGRQFPEGALNEDFYLLVQMLPQIGSIASLPQQDYHVFYRMGSNSRKREGFSRVFSDNVKNADMVMEIVKRDYPQLADVAFRFGVFQRLDYLLHIPIGQMSRDNETYRKIVQYLRRYWVRGMANPVLTPKNKCYHTILAFAPKPARILHQKITRCRKRHSVTALLLALVLSAGGFPGKAYGSEKQAFAETAAGLGVRQETSGGIGHTAAVPEWTQEDLAAIAQAREKLAEIAGERPIMALIYLAAEYPVRREASRESDILVSVPSGQTVLIEDAVIAASEHGYEAWEYVTFAYRGQEYSGYVPRSNLACSDQRFLEWEAEYGMNPLAALYDADGAQAAQNVEQELYQFPAGYREKLRQLKEKHPLWTFVPMQTGLDWNTVIAKEMEGSRSLVHSTCADWMKQGVYDDTNTWYFATAAAVRHFMDPRNWLVEDHIFQFELLTYNAQYHTEAALEKFLDATFMKSVKDESGKDTALAPGTVMTYAHIIWAIGAEEIRQVSPFHLAARIVQEQGWKGESPLISGTYPGYEGYYNYFNVGAVGSTRQAVIESGLKYAKEHDWKGAYYSILGGANVISANYIRQGQDTLYLQKFSVNSNYPDKLYWHQYMQNLSAPSNEGKITRNLYRDAGSLDNTFVFKIPIFKNMPGDVSTDVSLQIPAGYRAEEIYLDGIAYPSVSVDGRHIVTAADGSAKSAVVYQYNENGIPIGMYVWTLEYQNNAYAATPQPDMANLLGYHGFSIRITGKSGIRFKSSIAKELRNRLTAPGGVNGYVLKEYGTLIMDNANRGSYPMIKGGNKVMAGLSYGINAQGIREDKIFETVDERYRFTGVLVELPAQYYRTEFAFRGYAVLEKDGVQTMVYGPALARSIYNLAEQLLNLKLYPTGSSADIFLRKLIEDAS